MIGGDDLKPTALGRPGWWRRLWRRWLVAPVVAQLTGGISPNRIAWTIACGMVVGVFPVMGTTTAVCLLAGWAFRLNQVVLHVFRALVYPLHLALILVFIRLGERLYGAPLITLSIPQLLVKFRVSPMQFTKDFGMAAWHGVSAWLLVAPLAAVLIKMAVLPLLTQLAASIERQKEAAA
jgi:uncharacterized protein (DUF2062 family)